MNGTRRWQRRLLAGLCGLTGGLVVTSGALRAEPLTPSASPQPAVETTHTAPYQGFVAHGALRSQTGRHGDDTLNDLARALRRRGAEIQEGLAETTRAVCLTLIFGHLSGGTDPAPAAAPPPPPPPDTGVPPPPPSDGGVTVPDVPPVIPPPPPPVVPPPVPPPPPPPGGGTGTGEPPGNPPPTPQHAPEPTSLVTALLGLGLASYAGWRRRKNRRDQRDA